MTNEERLRDAAEVARRGGPGWRVMRNRDGLWSAIVWDGLGHSVEVWGASSREQAVRNAEHEFSQLCRAAA